jgi:hypothetical protein
MGVSTVTEMVGDKSAPRRFVRIADPQAIGAIFLRGRSLTRAESAFLTHLHFSKKAFAST